MSKLNIIQLKAPEGVSFPLILAGPIVRSMAWAIDLACISAISKIILFCYSIFNIVAHDLAMAVNILLLFFISFFYAIILEWVYDGKTLGKKICGLQVIDADGLRLSLPQVIIRNLLRFVDALPMFYMMGGLICLFSRHYKRLGDIAAGTLVVRNRKSEKPDVAFLANEKYNSLEEYPIIAARLRNNIPPDLSGLVLKALLRRNSLDSDIRIQTYNEIVEVLGFYAKFPQEATEGVSDERFLKNCLSVILAESIT